VSSIGTQNQTEAARATGAAQQAEADGRRALEVTVQEILTADKVATRVNGKYGCASVAVPLDRGAPVTVRVLANRWP